MRWPTPSGRPGLAASVGLPVLAIFLILTAPLMGVDPAVLAQAPGRLADLAWRLVSKPDWGYLATLIPLMGETVAIAFVATATACVLSFVVGLLAAQNTSFAPWVGSATKAGLALVRSLPELVWALLFVAAVGLGVLPGFLALVVTSVGMLGLFYASSFEVADRKAVEGVAAHGADGLAVRRFAILPQAVPDLLGHSLYLFDVNVRAATILGVVGAGGIGFAFSQSVRLFKFERLSLFLLSIYLVVSAIDRLSAWLRARAV